MVKSTGEQASLANAGEILALIASGAANSRAALLAASGMSRVTVTQRLNVLLGVGLVEETLRTLPSGGRPTRVLGIKGSAGFMLVADIGETHIHLAAMNLVPDILAQSIIAFSIFASLNIFVIAYGAAEMAVGFPSLFTSTTTRPAGILPPVF